jgi:hypothetical protein
MPTLTAEEILRRSIEVTGNAAAFAKVKTLVQKGEFTLNGSTRKGSILIQHKAPNKIRVTQVMLNKHVVRQVFDGKSLWYHTGQVNEAKAKPIEQEEFLRTGLLDSTLRWRQFYTGVTLGGKETVLRHTCYGLRFTTKTGDTVIRYIDAKTFLPLRIDFIAHTAVGPVPTQTYLSNYKKVGSIYLPFKLQTITPSGDIVVVITQASVNVPLDDKLFVRPSLQPKSKPKPTPKPLAPI